MPETALNGCAPDEFMHALKALGIFSVIAEQKDPAAKAYWSNDRFFMIDTKLNADEMVHFFCNHYKPIPLVSPWNKSSDFYKEGGEVSKIEQSTDMRLEPYKRVIHSARGVAQDVLGQVYKEMFRRHEMSKKERGKTEDQFGKKKEVMISKLRSKLPETYNMTTCLRPRSVLSWLDTAWAIKTAKNMTAGPVLLTGGNDGNFEMSVNFMKMVLKHVTSGDMEKEMGLVRNSLFGTATNTRFEEIKVGTYMPGAYMSSAVNSIGNDNYTLCNPWDYMFAMEGIVFFAGSIYRRGEFKFASFPFSVELSHAGYGTSAAGINEGEEKGKGEIWMPIWNNPATYDEIAYVFAEGRVQSLTKKPSTGADFAVALADFGAMRGLSAFQRFGVFERKGQACHITSIGSIHITKNTGGGATLQEIRWSEVDKWLDSIRSMKECPRPIKALLHMMEDKMIQYCTHKKHTHLLDILVTIGKIERQLALSQRSKKEVHPLKSLSTNWLKKCGYNTPEFRLAAALGSVYSKSSNGDFYPIRHNLEPVKLGKMGPEWMPASPSVTWGRGSLVQNMITVLERRYYNRLVGNEQIIKSHIYARVDDVVKFIEGRVDDGIVYDLVLPLSIIDYRNIDERVKPDDVRADYDNVPESYICLKSNFPPVPHRHDAHTIQGIFEPTITGLLKAGRQGEALDIMRRRLNISGYKIATYGSSSSVDGQGDVATRRMCAALFFPIHPRDMKKLLGLLQRCNGT